MRIHAVSLVRRLAVVAGVSMLASGVASAQGRELRGVVQSAQDGRPVVAASVTVRVESDSTRAVTIRTDSLGRFTITLPGDSTTPHVIFAQRVGFAPDTMRLERIPAARLQIFLQDVAQNVGAFEILERPTRNQVALNDATNRGWRVYGPEKVEPIRDRAGNLTNLMRMLSIPGIIPARHNHDCIRNTRNNQCLSVIVDGVNAGPYIHVTPNDIDFIALVNAAESRMFFGERAPYGAIVIYTRDPVGEASRARRRRP